MTHDTTGYIEPEADDDCDSGNESDSTRQSQTTSLSSGLQDWLVENGRLATVVLEVLELMII